MRVYLGSTADEVQDFITEQSLEVAEVYAPTPTYRSTHSEMDEEEIEFALSLLAAEDALELRAEGTGAAIVIALEISEEACAGFDDISAALNAPLRWDQVEALFTVDGDPEELTWFAPQEALNHIQEWLKA